MLAEEVVPGDVMLVKEETAFPLMRDWCRAMIYWSTTRR